MACKCRYYVHVDTCISLINLSKDHSFQKLCGMVQYPPVAKYDWKDGMDIPWFTTVGRI